jgi:elongation factor Tu
MTQKVSNKPIVNVGTIGHIDHGKSSLTTAIVAVLAPLGLAKPRTYQQITAGGVKRDKHKVVTVIVSHTAYESRVRSYAHVDCPGHADYVKNMIVGAAQMDGAILVVAADEGPMPQTREHLLLARQVGVPAMVVFLNRVDAVSEPELIDLVEAEVRSMLTRYGYDGDAVPVIRGSAKAAIEKPADPVASKPIWDLLDALDRSIPLPPRPVDKPFLMPIEGVHSIEGRGTVVTGLIERGRINLSDKVEIVGLCSEAVGSVCTGIERFNRPQVVAEAGENVGLLLRGVVRDQVRRGQVVVAPGSVQPRTHFRAEVYVLTADEGGRHTAFVPRFKPQFFFRTAGVTGEVLSVVNERAEGGSTVMPGDRVTMEVQLENDKPVALQPELRFAIREGSRTVGQGVVVEVLS